MKDCSLILFDADDTLFDFTQGARLSLTTLAGHYDIAHPAEEFWNDFIAISNELWVGVEQGTMDKVTLKSERFRRLFSKHKMNHDAVEAGDFYLEQLSCQTHMLPGALELCQHLQGRVRMGIITNGIESVQVRRLAASELKNYIEVMVVSEECGYAKPDVRIFEHALKRMAHTEPSQVLMVGDRLETDILGAHLAGMKSCWFNPGKLERSGSIAPDHEVHHLDELRALFIDGSKTP